MAKKQAKQTKTKSKRQLDTETVAQVIADMEEKTGRLVVPETLVRAARNPKHPLHHKFQWNDAKAAHEQRIDTARAIITSVRVVITTSTQKIVSVGYVRDPALPSNQSGYVSVARLRTEADNAEDALLTEVTRVIAALERAKELAAALNLVAEFETAWSGALQLHARLRKGRAKMAATEQRASL